MRSHKELRHVARWALAIALTTSLYASGQCLAQAPPAYEELPPYSLANRTITDWNYMSSFMRDEIKAVDAMLAGGAVDQAKFDQFFNDVVFPLFTQRRNFTHPTVSPAQMRKRFKSQFVAAAKSPQARDRLLDLTLASMQKIASGNYYPVARGNAMMMIAEINDGEPGPPLKKALPILLKTVQDKNAPDVIRVPAIRGILRHASAGANAIDANQRGPVNDAMLAIVKEHTAAPSQSLEGHEWILRRAIDVLAALGEPGANGENFNALVQVIEDPEAPRAARATAAAALSKIRYTPPKEYDLVGLATSLGKLGVTAYKAELEATESKRYPVVAGRLKQQLSEVRTGLVGADGNGGIAALMTEPAQKKFAADMVAQIDALATACDTKPDYPPDQTALAQVPTGDYVPGVPFDTQASIVKAITEAGGALEAVVQAGVGGGAPAEDDGLPGGLPDAAPPARAAAPAPRGGAPRIPPG